MEQKPQEEDMISKDASVGAAKMNDQERERDVDINGPVTGHAEDGIGCQLIAL